MQQFLAILGRESRGTVLSYRYALILLLLLLLVCGATAIRTRFYQVQVREYGAAALELESLISDTSYAELHRTSMVGTAAQKAPNALAIFAAGLENDMSRMYALNPYYNCLSSSDETQLRAGRRPLNHPAFRWAAALDLVFVVNTVCSLLALFLVYDSICGERERGTLRLLLSGPLPRDTLILGKLAAATLCVAVPLLLAWTLATLYVTLIGHVGLSTGDLLRITVMAGLSIVYVGLFLALGTAVSALVQRTATSLAACMALWVGLALAIPNLVPLAVEHLVPTPSESKMLRERDAITREAREVKVPVWWQEFEADSPYPRNATSMVMWFEMCRRAREETNRRYRALERFQEQCVERQAQVDLTLARLSPSASYVFAATHLAGTGVQDYLALMRDVGQYMQAYTEARDRQYRRMVDVAARTGTWFDEMKYEPALFPRFATRRVPLADALGACILDIGILCGVTVLLLLCAYASFMRYDVR